MSNYTTSISNPAVTVGNPNNVFPVKYVAYPTSSLGTVQVDENTDLSHERKFMNLYVMKSSWNSFTKVVDTSLSELHTNEPSQLIFATENMAVHNEAIAASPSLALF